MLELTESQLRARERASKIDRVSKLLKTMLDAWRDIDAELVEELDDALGNFPECDGEE